MNHSKQSNQKDAVFGIVVDDVLLYKTLKPNPGRAMRAYTRMGRPNGEKAEVVQFRMRRVREAGDVRGIFKEAMLNRGPYIGPMR